MRSVKLSTRTRHTPNRDESHLRGIVTCESRQDLSVVEARTRRAEA